MEMEPEPPFIVLLVEDSDAQAALVEAVLAEIETRILLLRAADVDEALVFLSQSKPFQSVALPALILLDLNLPPRSGYEILEAVLADSLLKQIPVVIFSTADGRLDREKSLSLGASAHIGKPLTLEGYEKALRHVVSMIPSGPQSAAN